MSLIITCAISLALSSIVCGLLASPLRVLIGSLCGNREAVGFWVRFTTLMLFLVPLVVALIFGLPVRYAGMPAPEVSDLVPRLLTTALSGLVIAMAIVGLRLSSVQPAPAGPSPRNDERRGS